MGDYTQARLVVHHVPADQAQAVLDILNDYRLDHQMSVEWGEIRGPFTEVPIGRDLTFEQVPVASSIDFVNDLSEAAPGVVVTAHTSPKFEYLGDLAKYAPGLGFWQCVCDDAGYALFTAEEIASARTMSDEAFAKLIGSPWDDALAALDAGPQSNSAGTSNESGEGN